MLVLDTRERGQLDRHLTRLGLPNAILKLEFGDCMFEGHGEFGPATIGIERKRLDVASQDLVTSMTDRRLSGHQLRGMVQSYDYVYLVVEGVWKEGSGGEIVVPRRVAGKTEWRPLYVGRQAVSYRQVVGYLDSLTLRVKTTSIREPLRVIQTSDEWQTAARYAALYRGFTEKLWHEHHSHDQLYTNTPKKGHGGRWGVPHAHANGAGGRVGMVAATNDDVNHPSTLWRMAAQLPGVDRRALAVAKHFKTVRRMVDAEPDEWLEIDGVGKKIRDAAVRAINEEGA